MNPSKPEKCAKRYPWPIVSTAVISLGVVGIFAAVLTLRFDEQGIVGPFARWDTAVLLVSVSFVIAYLLTWLARAIAPRIGLVDIPRGRKCHAAPTPLLGGVAVMGTLLACFFLLPTAGLVARLYDDGDLGWMLLSGLLFCLLGLWDDILALKARTKFVGQIAATLPFAIAVSPLDGLTFLGVYIPLDFLSVPALIFWLVSCVNVVNLIDGHDGLAASISAIAAFALGAIGAMLAAPMATAFALLLGGSLVGFLLHNRPPARIFLGDAGSMSIGFFIGAIALKASTTAGTGFAFMPPLVILGIPFFDTFVAMVRRKLSGRGVGEADRKHIHHRFQDRGLSPSGTLAAIVVLCLMSTAGALAAVFLQLEIVALVTCGFVYSILIASGFFAYEETILLVRSLIKTVLAIQHYVVSFWISPNLALVDQEQPEQHLVMPSLPSSPSLPFADAEGTPREQRRAA